MMGLFDWLTGGKSNVECPPDRIWMSEPAKFAGIAHEVARALESEEPPAAVFLVAHFPAVLAELDAAIDRARLDRQRVRTSLAKALSGPLGKIAVEERRVLIIVGERHPLRSHDEAIVEQAASVPGRCRLVFHLSLDDPLMRRFAGEWVREVLRNLGMEEDESIENKMVASRLVKAQKKIESHALSDRPAESAEKWFELNCPGA